MSNWQERIQKALSDRQDAESRQREERLRSQEAERRREAEFEAQIRQRSQEARTILESLGARDVLERVRQIWKVGVISVTEDEDNVIASLEWKRRGSMLYVGGGSAEYNSGGESRKVNGFWRDVLEIRAGGFVSDVLSVVDAHHFVEDKNYWDGKHWVTRFPSAYYHPIKEVKYVLVEPGNFSKARVELEQAILDLVEYRIRFHKLPLELK